MNQLIPLITHIDNSDPTFDNIHNSSINDCTDIIQTVDNSDIGDPNESKTETIDDNMQDQTSNTNNKDQNNSEFESTENCSYWQQMMKVTSNIP